MSMATTATNPNDPSNPSAAHAKMAPSWKIIDDILAGPATIRAAGQAYLPKYKAEGPEEYRRRLSQAPWQPEFADILLNLSSKPFGKEVVVKEGASDQIMTLVEDIDGRGNNLTAFARPMYRNGIAKGQHHILVDNTGRGQARTVAEERAAGVRPYWVSIRAEDILALYVAEIEGKVLPVHVRLRECTVERVGFTEKSIERVRVMNREPLGVPPGEPPKFADATWQLYEKQTQGSAVAWTLVGEGAFAPLREIPLASYFTGEREGAQYAKPPLDDLADKQIELYRALSRQDEILTYAGSPMLCAQGIAKPAKGETLEVGPKRVLFAPPGAEGKTTGWSYIQPDADNLTEIRESVKALVDDIRRLGMQPLTQRSGGVTATASSIEGAKAHSAAQAWALGLKDVLEQAMVFTSTWLGQEDTVEVEVDTDFSVEAYAQAPLDALGKARESGDLSRPAYLSALRRFDVLPPDFDADADKLILAREMAAATRRAKTAQAPPTPIDPALTA